MEENGKSLKDIKCPECHKTTLVPLPQYRPVDSISYLDTDKNEMTLLLECSNCRALREAFYTIKITKIERW